MISTDIYLREPETLLVKAERVLWGKATAKED